MSGAAISWGIVVAYLSATVWLGRRLGRGQRTVEDYFLAGRRMPWWAASLSIVGTETSTLTFVGVPAIAYGGDFTFLQVALGYVVGRIGVAAVLVPGYFKGELQTAYELLAGRFGGRVRTLSSAVFMASRCLADGVRLFATALVLQVLLPRGALELVGLPAETSQDVVLLVAILLVAGVTLAYTLIGGLRAVIWNDVVQLLLYLVGAGVAAWTLLAAIPGGWQGAAGMLRPADKLRWLELGWDISNPYTFWAGLVGGAVLTAATHGTDQMFVQRLLACGDRRRAQLALIVSGVVVFAQMALFLWIGGLLYAFYTVQPPAVEFVTNDQVFPRFIAEQLPPAIGGLVIAALLAAAMSTLSSSLSSLASASTLDVWARRRGAGERRSAAENAGRDGGGSRPDDSTEQDATAAQAAPGLQASRWMTAAWAAALAGVALLARSVDSVLEAGLSITSVTFGGVLGIFLVGLTSWRLGEGRAAVAMGAGIAVMLLVVLAPAVPVLAAPLRAVGLEGVAWTWYTSIGATTTFLCAALLRRR